MRSIGAPETIVVCSVAVALLALLVPTIIYLAALQKALQRCAPESRTMPPGQVWLMLIPLFNFVWGFIVVLRMASSLRNEFLRRQLPLAEPEPGKTLGIAMCILIATSWIPVGIVTGFASLVCWILYWVKIAGYSRQIQFPA
jgi:sterol desaturase/sphingolipid hydroxylase (fatty acid hydroxylase superfamily)